MKSQLFKIAIVTMVIVLSSCSKDGDDGETGPVGANGTNGIAGIIGNANVFGTNTWTSTSGNWTAASGNSFWSVTTSVPGITQAVVDRGVVSVFISDGGGGWFAMSYTVVNSWTYGFGVGFVNLYYLSNSGNTISNPGIQTFRIVIISPSNKNANPKVNRNNYEEVKKVLNLRD